MVACFLVDLVCWFFLSYLFMYFFPLDFHTWELFEAWYKEEFFKAWYKGEYYSVWFRLSSL